MPEDLGTPTLTQKDISTRPAIGSAISQINDSLRPGNLSLAEQNTLIDRMYQRGGEIRRSIEGRFPDYPPERLEAMLDLVMGFSRLKPKSLKEHGIKDPYENETSGRIQGSYVHHILSASQEGASPQYVEMVYKIARNIERLTQALGIRANSTLSEHWAGIRAEVALAKVLLDKGYKVFIPDYAQDTGEIDDNDNEVLQLDAKRGIDLLCVSADRRNVILIDAKGRAIPQPELDKSEKVVVDKRRTHQAVVKALEAISPHPRVRIFRTVLLIPSLQIQRSTLAQEYLDRVSQQRALSNFGNLPQNVKTSIMTQLSNLQKDERYGPLPATHLE